MVTYKTRVKFRKAVKDYLDQNPDGLIDSCEDCDQVKFDVSKPLVGVEIYHHHGYGAGNELNFLQLCWRCACKRRKDLSKAGANAGYMRIGCVIPEEYAIKMPDDEYKRGVWMREAISMHLTHFAPTRTLLDCVNRTKNGMYNRHLRVADRRSRSKRTIVFRLASADIAKVKEDLMLSEEELILTAIYELLKYEQERIKKENDTKYMDVKLPYLINVDEAMRIVK